MGRLDEREEELQFTEQKAAGQVNVVNAKLEALAIVADGDEEVVQAERRKKQSEKAQVKEHLVQVGESLEDARGLKQGVKKFRKQERDVKTSLRAMDVALEALELFGEDGVDAKELLVEAQRERSRLKAELKRIRQQKDQVDVRRNQLEQSDSRKQSRPTRNTRKIVPVVNDQSTVKVVDTAEATENSPSMVDDNVAAPVRSRRQTRRRKVRVISRNKKRMVVIRRNKNRTVTRTFSTSFLTKLMRYRKRRPRERAAKAAAMQESETHTL